MANCDITIKLTELMKLGISVIKSSISLKTKQRRRGHVASASDFQSERSESQLAESLAFRYHVHHNQFLRKERNFTLH